MEEIKMIVVMSASLSYIGHIALFGHFKLLLPFYINWPQVHQAHKFSWLDSAWLKFDLF